MSYLLERNFPAAGPVAWRLLDPNTGIDTLFLKLPSAPGGVRWDSTFTHVEYDMGGVIFRAAWALGARPETLATFPAILGVQDWWFNPDSSCWQAAAGRLINYSPLGKPTNGECAFELWQSSHDGRSWSIIRADTIRDRRSGVPCEWPWSGDSAVRREASTTLADLQAEMRADHWAPPEVPAVPPPGEAESDYPWLFFPSLAAPRRGIQLRLSAAEQMLGMAPIYYVDLERGSARRICLKIEASDSTGCFVDMQAECGYALIVSCFQAYVVDVSVGTELSAFPVRATDCGWVSPPQRWPRP